MIKYAVCLIVLVTAGVVSAQEVRWDTKFADLSPHLHKPVFLGGKVSCPECKEYVVDGRTYLEVRHNGKLLIFSQTWMEGYLTFVVTVSNLSDKDFLYDPSISVIDYEKDKIAKDLSGFKSAFALDPDKIAEKRANRVRWANALGAIGAGMQTTTSQTNGTVMTTGGSGTYSSTTTTPDYDARRRQDKASAERVDAARSTGDAMREIAFKANTMFPGTSKTGAIFFKNPKALSMFVIFPIDGYDYVFVFGKQK